MPENPPLIQDRTRECCRIYERDHLPCCDCPMYDEQPPCGTLPEPPEWGHGPASLGPVAP